MSEEQDDLELQALSRQLDDAFETTRPRADFEDELWLRMQSKRPAPTRLRDAFAGLWGGIRAVPAVPLSATALILIVAVGVGIIALNGHLGGGANTASGGSAFNGERAPVAAQGSGAFGRVPSPSFGSPARVGPSPNPLSGASVATQPRLVWSGTFDLGINTAPVYRYREPSTTDADQFASTVGAVLRERPSGFLGSYSASDYTLKVRGTLTTPASSPAYFIFSGLNLPPVEAAGGPEQQADIFLAEHALQPQWPYAVMVDSSSDPVKVVYQRQFTASSYGPAYLVDFNGNRYGLEVDITANRPVIASGMLPVSMDVADYRLTTAADAIASSTSGAQAAPAAGASAAPSINLTHAELVYVLVPAGDHSFFEPAFLFTGTLQDGGKTYPERVLLSALDPSQRNP